MRKVLVVDDEKAIRMLFADELSDEGFKVLTSNDYTSFINTVNQYLPDLLIFDVRPGNLEDLYLLVDIRNAGHTFPIIMCSSCPAFYDYIDLSYVDYYIIKSGNLSELKSKVKKALETMREVPASYYRNSKKDQQSNLVNKYPIIGSNFQAIKQNLSHII
jgi:DNA-binding response OmpR family regulator